MIKLSIQQQAVLTAAAAYPGGFAIRPASLKSSAAAKLAAKLIEYKLAREVRAKDGSPVWHEDEQGRALSLKLLKAGCELAAGLLPVDHATCDETASCGGDEAATVEGLAQAAPKPVDGSTTEANGRKTKRSLVLSLLARPGGATLADLTAATGWLPHTTRAALSILRKGGTAVERASRVDGASAYRVVSAAATMVTAAPPPAAAA